MKTPIQNKIQGILDLYSQNVSDNKNNNNISHPSESSSSYYINTFSNRNPSLNPNSYTDREFIHQKEWNDYEKKVNNTKRSEVYKSLLNTKSNKYLNPLSSNGNKKIKKKISTLTNNFCVSSPISPRTTATKIHKDFLQEEEETFSLKNNFSQKTLSKNPNQNKELLPNNFSFCSKRKPYKRFYIADLNSIKGTFIKPKINWREIHSPESSLSKKEKIKLTEHNDLSAYGNFSNFEIPQKEIPKPNKYNMKHF